MIIRKFLNTFLTISLSALLSGCSVHSKNAPSAASPLRLERLKSLAGFWDSTEKNPDTGKPDVAYYRVSSGGTTVAELLFPDTPHEMVSMYFQEGDTIAMTHYCMLGNQPQLRATRAEGNQIEFTFEGGTNINSKTDHYINRLVVTLVDQDHFRQVWSSSIDGKEQEMKTINFVRRKS